MENIEIAEGRNRIRFFKMIFMVASCLILVGVCVLRIINFIKEGEIIKPPAKGADAVVLRLNLDCPVIKNMTYADLLEKILESEGLPSGNPRAIKEVEKYIREFNPGFENPYKFKGKELIIPDFNGDRRFDEAFEGCGKVTPLLEDLSIGLDSPGFSHFACQGCPNLNKAGCNYRKN